MVYYNILFWLSLSISQFTLIAIQQALIVFNSTDYYYYFFNLLAIKKY